LKFLDNPDSQTLATVAAMHCSELPQSLISKLGKDYALAFYTFAASSPVEFVLAAIDEDGAVSGGGFVSLSPRDLQRRMISHTPLFGALLRKPILATRLLAGELLSLATRKDFNTGSDPELIAVFVGSGRRSRGIGLKILSHAESALRFRNCTRYFIRTTDTPDNRAIAFYERAGFKTVQSLSIHGEPFRFMAKQL
jgi:GNAT superfamily N-acetyltransferase